MLKRSTAAGLVVAALVATPGWAQMAAPPPSVAPAPSAGAVEVPATAASPFLARREPGVLRASDFIGQNVFTPEREDIGEVEDVLFGPNGQVVGLLIEVGGFLGIGDREVAVPIHAFQIEPATTATTGTIEGIPPSTVAGRLSRDEHRVSSIVYPERIVLMVPRDQIRTAPAFEDTLRRAGRRP